VAAVLTRTGTCGAAPDQSLELAKDASFTPVYLRALAISMAWVERAKLITEVMSLRSLCRQVRIWANWDNARIVGREAIQMVARARRGVRHTGIGIFAAYGLTTVPSSTTKSPHLDADHFGERGDSRMSQGRHGQSGAGSSGDLHEFTAIDIRVELECSYCLW
jgi:hypothetical protein